jgi:hypothetical protein
LTLPDLFGNDIAFKNRSFRRDRKGRFADKETERIEKIEREAAMYKAMFEVSESRNRGLGKMIEIQREEIERLKCETKKVTYK